MNTTALNSPASVLALVEAEIEASIHAKEALSQECTGVLTKICFALAERLKRGGKLLVFGNGGSAADAQHIAAEFVGRYRREREAIPALALTVNTSVLTAVANDYGYEEVFARQIEAFGTMDDAAMGISTSGQSANVLCGIRAARERGMLTIGMTGHSDGKLKELTDLCLCVPAETTARIQECHILAGHILSEYCEQVLGKPAALRAGTR
jgi:D-sedoheptulose 7-phosphate isomerase